MHLRRGVGMLALWLGASACPADPGSDASSETTASGDPVWVEFADGCVSEPFTALEDGSTVTMVLGGQGLLMFPMHVRAGGVSLPEDFGPTDPETPKLDFRMRVDGYNNGPADTFARIANYPVLFSPLEGSSDTWDFSYLTVFVPDELTGGGDTDPPQVIDGLTATIEYEFEVEGHPIQTGSFTAVISVPEVFEPDPSCGF